LRRDLIQLRLWRITEVHCSQSLRQRLVGAGRLIVDVDGESPLVVDHVRQPRALQRVLNDLLFAPLDVAPEDLLAPAVTRPAAYVTGPLDPTPPHGTPLTAPLPPASPGVAEGSGVPRPTSIHAQLIQLDDLRRRGILSDAEFETKKAELLSRL